MSQETVKKTKISTESVIRDIATSIESIAKSLESINKSHGNLLRLNKSGVALKLAIDKEKEIDLDTTVPLPQGDFNVKLASHDSRHQEHIALEDGVSPRRFSER